MEDFTPQQQRFFARIAHWLPQLYERSKMGTAEMRVGKRRLPDGRLVEICITCRTIEGGEVSPAASHGMIPPSA